MIMKGVNRSVMSGEPLYPNTFRKTSRRLTDKEFMQHGALKDKAAELLQLIHQLPESRERSMAHTKLEEAVMWAVKGLTA